MCYKVKRLEGPFQRCYHKRLNLARADCLSRCAISPQSGVTGRSMRRDGVIEKKSVFFYFRCWVSVTFVAFFLRRTTPAGSNFFVVGFRESSIMQSLKIPVQGKTTPRLPARENVMHHAHAGANYFSSPAALGAFVSRIDTHTTANGKSIFNAHVFILCDECCGVDRSHSLINWLICGFFEIAPTAITALEREAIK